METINGLFTNLVLILWNKHISECSGKIVVFSAFQTADEKHWKLIIPL